MRYVKALTAGLVFALATLVAWLGLKLVAFSLYWRLVALPRLRASGSGGFGSVSVMVADWELLVVGAVGFTVGAWWVLRRRQVV